MPDHLLSEAEAEHILAIPKWVEVAPKWSQDQGGNWVMKVPVEAHEDLPLSWYARFNPRTGVVATILFWNQINVRRLDAGKKHHNPDCRDVGRVHKHRWTDGQRNREAYEPAEIALTDPVATILKKFCDECNIELRVTVHNPPRGYQGDLHL